MHSKSFLVLIATLCTWAVVAEATADKQAEVYEVKIDNFSFIAQTITVPVGSKVKWINHDDMPHNVVSSEQKFKSKVLDTDESFEFTFTEPGTYSYYCGLHPKMVGKVIVEAPK